jgi:hypothetical protein
VAVAVEPVACFGLVRVLRAQQKTREDAMSEPESLLEVYGLTDPELADQIVRRLRRKRYVDVTSTMVDGRAMVIVECRRPSRAHTVFNQVTTVDPGAVLLRATADIQDVPAV